jgi:hypothetical protein
MDEHEARPLRDITRPEWILWNWIEMPMIFGETEQMYWRGKMRDPSETRAAALDFDCFLDAAKAYKALQKIRDEEPYHGEGTA